ncbi:hypothetical protein GCM10022251_51210 [Phytohabitans flavus]
MQDSLYAFGGADASELRQGTRAGLQPLRTADHCPQSSGWAGFSISSLPSGPASYPLGVPAARASANARGPPRQSLPLWCRATK